ncbi:MAG: AMP-binding protein [Actinobacteria bacterium]|nr:AMP-binding protein [Actinomycetota bacterium]
MTSVPTCLPSRIEHAAREGGVLAFITGDEVERVEWGRLHEEARGVAAGLQARGVGPGDHVALLAGTSRALVTAIEAVWWCGATVVVLPLPMRLGSVEEFVDGTRRRIRRADTSLLVADPALLEFWSPAPRSGGRSGPGPHDPPIALLGELGGHEHAYERPADDPESLAILQFTSGSTADPKGVMLPHRCVTANLDGIAAAAELDPEHDVVVSWLPLYHDMGLIGTLTLPMTTGTDLVLAAPQDFLASPRRWMEWMSAFGGTATAGPNFSYALAARGLRRLDGLDLSRWRLALNGAEPVDPLAVEAFCAAGLRHGLDPSAAYPAFGMAEATLAVTFPEPGSGLAIDRVDRHALEHAGEAVVTGADDPAKVRDLALLGSPVQGLEVRIVDPASGCELGERLVGELEIRGTSVTPGYYRDEAATAAAFHDGWLRTGDLGYLADGQLAVCGRLKDLIIVGGRNVFPEDAERAAAAVEEVRDGNVIAFGTEGRRGEGLVVVAETRLDPVDEPGLAAVRGAVAQRVKDAVGLPAREIVLVRPGTLPKTSSGKLQRSLCRDRYRTQALEPV